jgi:DNA-binding protein WhiA
MSFASQVKEELNSINIKSNCCKKAYLFGAIMNAEKIDDMTIRMKLSDSSTVDKVVFLLKAIYKIVPTLTNIRKGCFCCTEVLFESKRLAPFLDIADSFDASDERNINISDFFTCQNCAVAFLRGVFCASGSVSDPQKSYTLEMRPKNDARAAFISNIAELCGLNPPCKTARKGAIGLFYRNESSIEDFLTACGVNKALFEFFDVYVQKDLRNSENRATNCVAKNISKSVEASSLHIQAIEALIANGIFDELSSDVKKTALLRIDNPEISLSELAQMHTPAISKSGLNHRLARLIEIAKKHKLV